jgi:hypothetical protein
VPKSVPDWSEIRCRHLRKSCAALNRNRVTFAPIFASSISRASLYKLGEHLLDVRTIGRINKITLIVVSRSSRGTAASRKPRSKDIHVPNPVTRSHFRNGHCS